MSGMVLTVDAVGWHRIVTESYGFNSGIHRI